MSTAAWVFVIIPALCSVAAWFITRRWSKKKVEQEIVGIRPLYRAYVLKPDGTRELIMEGNADECQHAALWGSLKYRMPCIAQRIED